MKSTRLSKQRGRSTISRMFGLAALGSTLCMGQNAMSQEYELELTGTTANVVRANRPVRINLFRLSTDEERDAVATAWTNPGSTSNGNGGNQGGGFGGRGGGGGDADREPMTPVAAVTSVIHEAQGHGQIWTDGPVGYSVRYAVRQGLPDGGERIVLATNRRLDAHTTDWMPTTGATPTDYEFTLIEIRLDSDGVGEARTSLTNAITLDDATGTLVLDDYAMAPVILDDVMR